MDNKTKLYLTVVVSMAIYFLLTLPMNIENGEYMGIIYPQWLCIVIGLISTIFGNITTKHIIKQIEKNKRQK